MFFLVIGLSFVSVSPKAFKQKLVAGSTIPFCSIEKQLPGTWSPLEPSSFRVRGKNYLRYARNAYFELNFLSVIEPVVSNVLKNGQAGSTGWIGQFAGSFVLCCIAVWLNWDWTKLNRDMEVSTVRSLVRF